MPLTDFKIVDRQEHTDGSVAILANDGRARVVAFVSREAMEDYGGKYSSRPHLSYEQRVFLLRSDNTRKAVATVISEKYDRGETGLYTAAGSTLKRVDIDLADLERAPRLVLDGAGFH